MRYIITTLGRITRQETLANLPESIADKVELWVQAHEYENSCLYYDDVHALPDHIRTLGPTRQYLLDLYRGEKIVLMDDDLTFYWREDPKDWHLTIPPELQMMIMFGEVETALDKYAHVGLSGREGQNHESAYSVECTRYMRFLAYNTAMFPDHVRLDRVSGMSDFDCNIQLLRAGLPSLVFYRWAQGQKSTQQPGGCTLERTRESHFAEVRRMCELHPGLVVPRKKMNRSGGVFGQRDEVTVAWKMALGWDTRAADQRQPTELEVVLATCQELRTKCQELSDRLTESEVARVTLEESSQISIARIAALEQAEKDRLLVIPKKLDRRKRALKLEEPPKC